MFIFFSSYLFDLFWLDSPDEPDKASKKNSSEKVRLFTLIMIVNLIIKQYSAAAYKSGRWYHAKVHAENEQIAKSAWYWEFFRKWRPLYPLEKSRSYWSNQWQQGLRWTIKVRCFPIFLAGWSWKIRSGNLQSNS